MGTQDKVELKVLFQQDGKKTLQGIGRLFADFDSRKWNPARVTEVFQWVHSLKSEATFLGYGKVAADAERLEGYLSLLQKRPPTGKEWREFQQVYLSFEKDLGSIIRSVDLELTQSAPEDPTALNEFEKTLLEEARIRGERAYRVEAEVDEGEPMPFPRLYLLINALELRTHVLRVSPPLSVLRSEKVSSCSVLITSPHSPEQVNGWIKNTGLKRVEVHPLRVDDLLKDPPGRTSPYRKPPDKMLSVPSSYFYIQELLTGVALEEETVVKETLLWGIVQQGGIPLGVLLEKAGELTKDLGLRLNKNLSFGWECKQEIKLPFRVFEGLNIMLNHLIRNAVDHGIEPERERVELGKPPEGRVTIRASRVGTVCVLEVKDDGRGIQKEAIAQVAKERGVSQKGWETDDEVLSFLVQGGVSTKQDRTPEQGASVSGRGMGLQTVSACVEKYLGGKIEMGTTPGKGTVFIVRFDLLRANHPVFPFPADEGVFLVPKGLVEDVFPLSRESIKNEGDRHTCAIKGKELPVKVLSTQGKKEGLGVLLNLGEPRGLLWAESLPEERWVSLEVLRKSVEEIIHFIRNK